MRWLGAMFLCAVWGVGIGEAGNVPTAKRVADLVNARSPSAPPNQLIRMEGRAADSDGRPRQWDVTVYDPMRGNRGTVLRYRDGVLISEGGAVRLFDDARWSRFGRNFSGYDVGEIIGVKRWKLDSTDAVSRLLALPGMATVQLADVRMTLVKLSDGDVPPVWRVQVRARSRTAPAREAWVGTVVMSAETGEIIRNELRLERLAP